MEIEQKFTKSDLEDIYQVLLLSNNNRKKMKELTDRAQKENWIRTMKNVYGLFTACIVILLWGIRMGLISMETKTALYIAIGGTVFYLLIVIVYTTRKVSLRELVHQVEKNAAAVVLKEDTISYRGSEFGYADIRHIIEYHDLLYIICTREMVINGKSYEGQQTLFVRAESAQKREVLSLLYEKSGVRAVQKWEKFSLQEYYEGR